MAEERGASPPAENTVVLNGIQRALPGLDSFLRDKLPREHLTPEVEAQLVHFIQLLDQLEGDISTARETAREETATRHIGSVSSDQDEENIAFSGFLVQGTRHLSNILAWNRRWCVLGADDNILRAYSMRSRNVQKPLWELELEHCRISLVDPRDSGEKTSAFRITPPIDTGLQPYLLRTYEESEMHRCVDALAKATGQPHTNSELRTLLTVSNAPGARVLSASPNTMRAASTASHRAAILPSGEEIEIDDGDGLYDIPPTARQAGAAVPMDATYDVPPPRSGAGPSRSTSDFDFPTDEQLASPEPNDDVQEEECDIEDNYAELNFGEEGNRGKSPKTNPRESNASSTAPELPTRTSRMMVTSTSDPSSVGRASQTIKAEQVNAAKESYEKQEEDLYASMPDDILNDVHLSDSNTDDCEGMYEQLDITGYDSSTSTSSIFEFFKRNSKERKSGNQKKSKSKEKKEKKDHRLRLSCSVADLVDPDQDGYLVKRTGKGITWRRRWFVLKDRALYYFRSQDDDVARNAIILPGWKLSAVSDEARRPFTFKLSHDGMSDCFLSAETSDSYDTWIALLEHCLRIPNGNDSTPYGINTTPQPLTKDAVEAENLMKAIGDLSAPQWGEDDVAATSNGLPAPDSVYDHPRPNAGSLASEGFHSSSGQSGPSSQLQSPSAVSQSSGLPPPIPNGPRPSPRPAEKFADAPDLPEHSTYQDVPRNMKRQNSEYDTDLYLAPAEARTSGRSTPLQAERSRSTTPASGASPALIRQTPTATTPSAITSTTASAAVSPYSGDEADTASPQQQRKTDDSGGGFGGFLRRSFRRKKENVIKPATVLVHNGIVEGVLNRRGPIKWSTHYCQLKSGHFLCYKGDDKSCVEEGAAILDIRLLGQEIRNADREAKRSNSFSLSKASQQRRNQSTASSRALYFQSDNDEDYRLWFKHIKDSTQIQNEPVLPDEDTYQVPRPAQQAGTTLPSWLQDELHQKQEAEAMSMSTGRPIAGNPLWWAVVSSNIEETFQGPLSIKHGTVAALRSWKAHWCTVAGGRLNCFRQRTDTESVVELQLGGQLLSHAPERGKPFCFNIFIDQKLALCLSVEVKKDLDDWMALLLTTAGGKAAEADVPLFYNYVPKTTSEAAKPVVRQPGSSDIVADGAGYFHEILPDRNLAAVRSGVDDYQPPDVLLVKIAKAPQPVAGATSALASSTAAPVSQSTAMPPVYKPNVDRPEASRAAATPAMAAAAAAASAENVHDGYLQKRSGPSLWHRRYCYLQGTMLHLYSQKGSQNPIQKQSLANCGLGATSKDGKKDAFKVTPPSPHPRIYLQATSSRERADWMEALQKAIVEASASTTAVGIEPSRRRLSFRRPKSNVINMSVVSDAEDQPRKRGLIGRLRSWSQENISRRSSRHSELVEPGGAATGGYDQNSPQPFVRGTVSLGHGEFKRARGGKPVAPSAGGKSMSGVLFLNYGSGEGSMWCKVADGELSAFSTPQNREPAYAANLAGAHIKLSSHPLPQDRVVTIDGGSLQKPVLIRVNGQAKTFDDWVSALQSSTVQEKPLKRSLSMRIRRSIRRRPAPRKRGSDPAPSALPSGSMGTSPLDLATPSRPPTYATGGGGAAPKPLGSRPLPRPPGQLPTLPQPPSDEVAPLDSLLPGYASRLTSDLNALTTAVDIDDTPSKKDSRTPSLPSDDRRPSQATVRAPSAGRETPETPAVTVLPGRDVKSPPAKKTPSPAETGTRQGKAVVGTETSPPSASLAKQTSSSSLEKSAAKKTPPAAPRRMDSISNGPSSSNGSSSNSYSIPPPVIRQVKNSPRPRAHTDVQMSAPPPPPSGMSSPAVYSDLLKEYENKAKSVNVQATEQRTTLTQERIDLVRQQVDLEDRIRTCNVRLATVEAKGKGNSTVFKGRVSGEDPFEIKRERAELQNKGGWVEGKIQRIDDQILRVGTELSTAIDRLEKERNARIEQISAQELESAM
ncbi:uncharacterized protein LOC135821846 isoform X2 [Sycon ciliatum]|uniref:uncharacterized protein LOC135821846 isoform X2 n=1 Tax=Sycon ciliatum TaxID=27933 RepID=UPI0031F6390E